MIQNIKTTTIPPLYTLEDLILTHNKISSMKEFTGSLEINFKKLSFFQGHLAMTVIYQL